MKNKFAQDLWADVKSEMTADELTLSPKMSFTVRHSLTGMLFILARYKFVVKMIQNRKNLTVIDFGCNDGLGDLMISQNCNCKELIGIDFDKEAILWARQNVANEKMRFVYKDFLGEIVCAEGGDCAVSLDVIEHIPLEYEELYLDTICNNLHPNGVAIIGTPNDKIYPYANPINKKAHINNYSQERLYETLSKKFHQVFIFGLNDEVLHTGFYPMSCYIMALCCNKKN